MKRWSWAKRPPTKEQYDLLDLARPLTDAPLGKHSSARRRTDARRSKLAAARNASHETRQDRGEAL